MTIFIFDNLVTFNNISLLLKIHIFIYIERLVLLLFENFGGQRLGMLLQLIKFINSMVTH